ncbi:hypothetical protein [Oceanihabitans sediminis]|uniref:Uncharacterized protein n=1 Tax=Oceanihabitans sediminis TaxID=1812012 RepID=A0A368P4A4_9FLAO|nr:hypothetical protein [Oceanihabitans sediminis]MDX1279416.1 hypothetical protein [Oceanihabitans sediminis]MDX1774831.1 hypothetical protein [Oceanihabitans sediminis]RBP27159.1 hypothetical protein DFR65_1101 [Oceanihabitans sediminis]RCU57110.1 hypothetical protein DU428_09200 [Oceanihabitans sediminis]
MAKYKSLFKVEGSIDDLNFYKTEDGYRMRSKGGVSKSRIQNDPAFERTRENNSEFGLSATSGKLLRRAIVDMVSNAKDNKLSSRVTQVMTQVKNFDLTSPRGQRNVANGIITPDGKIPLKGFNFNRKSTLSEVLLSDYTLDTATGEVVINNFTPNQKLMIPGGATHVEFTAGFLNIDFSTGEKDFQISNVENLAINGTTTTVTLTPAAPATGTGQSFYLLKVAFFQEINNLQYPLKNGVYNALQILEVL